jgi:DNA primase
MMQKNERQSYSREQIEAAFTLSSVVGETVILERAGNFEHKGLCPFHDEKTGSFTVNDKKRFYHCFGCGAHGSLFDWWMWQHNLSFSEALADLARQIGVQGSNIPARSVRRRGVAQNSKLEKYSNKKNDTARRLWKNAKPAPASLAEIYLRARGIDIDIPPSLRFLDRCPSGYDKTGNGQFLPAMIAGIQDLSGKVIAVHRTYLAADGRDKIKNVQGNAKQMLGRMKGGAARFAAADEKLIIAEGIETALSLYQALEGRRAVWAGLSITGMGSVILPAVVREVILACDNDTKAPREQAEYQAQLLRARNGIIVRLVFPPSGMDFNDWLQVLRGEHGR